MIPEFPEPKAIQIYTAILTQTGTGNPTSIILHNTFPDNSITTWTRFGTGNYLFNMEGLTPETTAVFITQNVNVDYHLLFAAGDEEGVTIEQTNITGTNVDGMQNVIIEIRKYN